MMLLLLWLLMDSKPTAVDIECRETCEVLEMEFVTGSGCDCFCYDPIIKSIDVLTHPDCLDVE